MVAALRRLGFDPVFDTDFAADLTIVEEGTELSPAEDALATKAVGAADVHQLFAGLGQFHGVLPSRLLPHLSTCKSPQQMFGAVAKTYYAEKLGKRPEHLRGLDHALHGQEVRVPAAGNDRQRRARRGRGAHHARVGKMIRAAGIDFDGLPDEEMDAPLGLSTGAADIFANTGGVMEAALRTAYESSPAQRRRQPARHPGGRPARRQGGLADDRGHAA